MSRTGMYVAEQFEWCGCGNPEKIDELMLAYLEKTVPNPIDNTISMMAPIETDLDLVLAYMATHAGWTDHGGSIHGSWLTTEGRQAIEDLKQPEEEL